MKIGFVGLSICLKSKPLWPEVSGLSDLWYLRSLFGFVLIGHHTHQVLCLMAIVNIIHREYWPSCLLAICCLQLWTEKKCSFEALILISFAISNRFVLQLPSKTSFQLRDLKSFPFTLLIIDDELIKTCWMVGGQLGTVGTNWPWLTFVLLTSLLFIWILLFISIESRFKAWVSKIL